jgi:hypothetical protein
VLLAVRDADESKTVFVVDNAYHGLVPASLDFENRAVLSSLDLDSALKSLDYLNKTHLKPSDFTAYFGYPETDSDIKAIFGDEKTAKVETWSDRIREVRELSQEFGFRLYGSPELNTFRTKEAVLAEIHEVGGSSPPRPTIWRLFRYRKRSLSKRARTTPVHWCPIFMVAQKN